MDHWGLLDENSFKKSIHSMGTHVFLHLLGVLSPIFVGLSLTLHFSRFWGPKILVEPKKFDDLYVRWKSKHYLKFVLDVASRVRRHVFLMDGKTSIPKGSNVGTTFFPEGGFFSPTSRVSMKNAL